MPELARYILELPSGGTDTQRMDQLTYQEQRRRRMLDGLSFSP
jgi:hypothetical protein